MPGHKDPRSVDVKLVAKYGIAGSESTRLRRKRAGHANLQYIRHGRYFAILATKGAHQFFAQEGERVRDIRRDPISYAGYSISYRRGGRTRAGQPDPSWHSHVSIERVAYLGLRASLLEMALRRANDLAAAFYDIPFERYVRC